MTKKRNSVLADPNLPFLLNTYLRLCENAAVLNLTTAVVVIDPTDGPRWTCPCCTTEQPVDEMSFLLKCLNCSRHSLVVEPGNSHQPTTVEQKGG